MVTSKYKLEAAIELWKRWFDWSGNPWEVNSNGDECCFFCGELKPNHEVDCVYTIAKELVSLDEKGELSK